MKYARGQNAYVCRQIPTTTYNYLHLKGALSRSLSLSPLRQYGSETPMNGNCMNVCMIYWAECAILFELESERETELFWIRTGGRKAMVCQYGLDSITHMYNLFKKISLLYIHTLHSYNTVYIEICDKRWLNICHLFGWFSADNNSAQFHFNVYLVIQWNHFCWLVRVLHIFDFGCKAVAMMMSTMMTTTLMGGWQRWRQQQQQQQQWRPNLSTINVKSSQPYQRVTKWCVVVQRLLMWWWYTENWRWKRIHICVKWEQE